MLELVPDDPEKLTEDKVIEALHEIDEILDYEESHTQPGRIGFHPNDPCFEEPLLKGDSPLLRFLSTTKYDVLIRKREGKIGRAKAQPYRESHEEIQAEFPRISVKDLEYTQLRERRGASLSGNKFRKSIVTLSLGQQLEMEDLSGGEYGIVFNIIDAKNTEGRRLTISAFPYAGGRRELPRDEINKFDPAHLLTRHNHETAELLIQGIKAAKENEDRRIGRRSR